jgi:ABC-type transport system involved in multi-copper enzyme maturation permease subunit
MITLIRTELLKLRTMRMTWGLLAAAAALSAMFALLENNRAGSTGSGVPSMSTPDGMRTVTTVTGIAMLLAAVLGTIAANGEFRHSSATLTYLAAPQRGRVLVAKTAAAAAIGALFGLVAGVVATGVGLIFINTHGDRVPLSKSTLIGHIAGATAAAALLAALGVAIGTLIRSQLSTVIGVFLWAILMESIIGGVYTSVRPFLPYTAATTMAGVTLGNAAFGPAHGVQGGGPLPFVGAAALLAVIAACIAFVATRTTLQHDIT